MSLVERVGLFLLSEPLMSSFNIEVADFTVL